MREAFQDGKLQVTAAASLLENSRLVEWIPLDAQFVPVQREIFEHSIRQDVDPVFGRLICWIIFSSGAEFLAKGVCLVRGIEIRNEHQVPLHPSGNVHTWVPEFRKNWRSQGVMTATFFGTIGNLMHDKNDVPAALARLCAAAGASAKQKDLLFAAYELLSRTIRNRDAHAYIPNVRDWHFFLVPDLFCNCFNLLISWLPNGPRTLNKWRAEAQALVASV